MVDMDVLNDAELLNNLKIRFFQNIYCTYIGPTLLTVNPFKPIPQYYTPEVRKMYIQTIIHSSDPVAYKSLPPHVFAIAAEAYRSL